MRIGNHNHFSKAIGSLSAFVLWTILVCRVDVQTIGPQRSAVGFARVNGWFHNFTGVHMDLYVITDWLSLIPLVIVLGFALLGLVQWIQRRSLRRVDPDILLMGAFYAAVFLVYLLFEQCVINYRPVLIEGILEASYPSSTTMLVLCVMPTAWMQGKMRIRHQKTKGLVVWTAKIYTVAMVAGRLISGVHWLTDIIGGLLLSMGLVLLYCALCTQYCRKK